MIKSISECQELIHSLHILEPAPDINLKSSTFLKSTVSSNNEEGDVELEVGLALDMNLTRQLDEIIISTKYTEVQRIVQLVKLFENVEQVLNFRHCQLSTIMKNREDKLILLDAAVRQFWQILNINVCISIRVFCS